MAQRCRVVLKNFLAGLMSRALSGAQGGASQTRAVWGMEKGRQKWDKAAQWDRMTERERRVCACVRVCVCASRGASREEKMEERQQKGE